MLVWNMLKKFYHNFFWIFNSCNFLISFTPFQMDKLESQDGDLKNMLAFKVGGTFVFHPLELSKVLIQLGHEPIAPRNTKTLLGRPALAYPSVFQVKLIQFLNF